MFSKFALITLIVGALSVNALTIPIDARFPSPEPQGDFIPPIVLHQTLDIVI